ncbi:gas vesicle protein [Streptomyces sp. ISL-1]|uniref:gas vesicle protein GvpO n=1 Tax=Streptomyces sp. ISL-1 TaxID=2817657 RepID=UPI001BE538F2|nr:gas vesicle protein GvpO [Streptomyces sp. ISL-1]MBT2392560.1 gas vesicle protein [Streptomyces sp. ISL-1]
MPRTERERGAPEAEQRRRSGERESPDRHSTRDGTSGRSRPNGDEGEADEPRRLRGDSEPDERRRRRGDSEADESRRRRGDSEPDSSRRRPAITARKAAQYAARHVQDFTGEPPEGVTSLESTEDGWQVGIEVVETHRIPDSTDILAVYRVEVDEEGELVSYRRDRRYYRGRADEQ